MSALTWPTLTQPPARMLWGYYGNTQVHESPLTSAAETQELPGLLWTCTVVYEALAPDDAHRLRALLMRLRGRAGRVNVPTLAHPAPRGVATGTPLVKGAAQTGTALLIDGAGVGVTRWLREGDFVGIEGLLYMQTADVNTNGAGEATLSLSPPMLTAHADNAPLVLTLPTVKMRLTDDRQGWEYTGAPISDLTIDLVEDPS